MQEDAGGSASSFLQKIVSKMGKNNEVIARSFEISGFESIR